MVAQRARKSDDGRVSLGMVTDLYELRMTASYVRRGMTEPATFSLFSRTLPRDRGFLVAAGLADVLRVLRDFSFDDADTTWLADQGLDETFLDWLGGMRFTGDVWAVPEGRVVFPDEPLLEITAPLPEAQLVETIVLNQITYQTALASKATRCRLAAAGRAALIDFSLRRTHGIEAGMAAARAGAIAGFMGTSNVEAARRFDITAVGTMAHSYIEAFADEREAFVAFAEDFPDQATLLVDTYNTRAGLESAVEVASSLGVCGGVGVRLDSGDLHELSTHARLVLDRAGFPEAAIVASGGLDEFAVKQLLDAGAPIDAFGVGTRVGVSADAPSLDSAYKLVEYAGRPVMKLSPGKETRPGPKQVYRSDLTTEDLLATRSEAAPADSTPLLERVMAGGEPTNEPETVAAIRDRLAADLESLPPPLRELHPGPPPPVRISARLEALTAEIRDSRLTGQ
jgi:nicotinate phosphoribosyltransferase